MSVQEEEEEEEEEVQERASSILIVPWHVKSVALVIQSRHED